MKKAIVGILHRYHITMFVVGVAGGLVVVVFLLNAIILKSGENNGYTGSSNDATFDQATITRIKQLHTAGEGNTPLDLTQGRTNPFVE